MKIYTGFGDSGKTALFGGETVLKDDDRVEIYGGLDELNSFIGLTLSQSNHERINKLLTWVQNELFVLGSEIATPDSKQREKFKDKIDQRNIQKLEQSIDEFTLNLPELKNFILPGGHPAAASAHVARTVCRRTERLMVHFSTKLELRSEIIIYMNRLGDLLFTVARALNKYYDNNDIIWSGIRK